MAFYNNDILFFGLDGGFSGFGNFGRGRSSQNRASKGQDIRVVLNLTFEEAIFGCEKDVKLNLTSECSSCHGKGGFEWK